LLRRHFCRAEVINWPILYNTQNALRTFLKVTAVISFNGGANDQTTSAKHQHDTAYLSCIRMMDCDPAIVQSSKTLER
jgi:hypothetical protein